MKKISLIFMLVLFSFLTACQSSEHLILYEGEKLPISQVEENIAAKLKAENPNLDIGIEVLYDIDLQ